MEAIPRLGRASASQCEALMIFAVREIVEVSPRCCGGISVAQDSCSSKTLSKRTRVPAIRCSRTGLTSGGVFNKLEVEERNIFEKISSRLEVACDLNHFGAEQFDPRTAKLLLMSSQRASDRSKSSE